MPERIGKMTNISSLLPRFSVADAEPIPVPEPDCRRCNDARYVTALKPGSTFERVPVACPSCGFEAWDAAAVGFGTRAPRTFATYTDRPETAPFRRACDDVLSGKRWLAVLCGNPGSGKTHLAEATVVEWLERRKPRAYFAPVPALLDMLRRAEFDRDLATDRGSNPTPFSHEFYQTRGLLVLDDLGADRPTEYANEALFRIINARTSAQLPTIVTTNRKIDGVEWRIRSRLAPGLVVVSGAPDLRPFYESQEDQS